MTGTSGRGRLALRKSSSPVIPGAPKKAEAQKPAKKIEIKCA